MPGAVNEGDGKEDLNAIGDWKAPEPWDGEEQTRYLRRVVKSLEDWVNSRD